MSSSTSYNYVAVAKVDDDEFVSATGNFTTLAPPTPTLVDLGLSVKWASFNLGASKPTEYGGYYQWAGTKDVSDTGIYLNWSNCPYHTGSSSSSGWTKYNTDSSYGVVDTNTVLETMDDAASVSLGDSWRMPTDEEWSELMNTDNCSWTWTTIDGTYGYKVQSKKPGYTDNWIFLPAAGCRDDDNLYDVRSYGYYWSSSLHTIRPSRLRIKIKGGSAVRCGEASKPWGCKASAQHPRPNLGEARKGRHRQGIFHFRLMSGRNFR